MQVLALMQGLVSFMASNHGAFMETMMTAGSIADSLKHRGAPASFIQTFQVQLLPSFLYKARTCISRVRHTFDLRQPVVPALVCVCRDSST